MGLVETVMAILAAGALLVYGTLELWFAPHNSSFFKGWKQKLAVILPLYTVTFGIWFAFCS
ncbi:hypothetical protein [Priestia aryabhattai]|uniref:hypothetical protein n=2 Tax=Priestia aryabhattai TaxID=412384 RepID=UPI0007ABBE31|nr:hypothetical protein [Priestia aryabhattai]KZE14312.1 hypothetical protein AVW12_19305 [Priestia aryabhattai]